MPHFDGSKNVNVRHFFLKVKACFAENNVINGHVKRRYLMHCLSDDALELYLALQPDQQTNLKVLEKIFVRHFRPSKHRNVQLASFIKSRKEPDETVSEYALRLHKAAKEIGVQQELLAHVFIQGLPVAYQKHAALQDINLTQMDDIFRVCEKFHL